MAALVFPTSPTTGDKYPDPAVAGAQQWEWDGSKWMLVAATPPPPAELPGLGGWAEISAVTGSPTRHDYTDADGNDWSAFEWTGNGSVTTTAGGLVDAVVVGAGGSNGVGATCGGGAGQVRFGINLIGATETIKVGTTAPHGNDQQGTKGGTSKLGTNVIAYGGWGSALYGYPPFGNDEDKFSGGGGFANRTATPNNGGGSSFGDPVGQTPGPGLKSSITGTEREYGRGGQLGVTPTYPDQPGWGARSAASTAGTNGIVIIRVPKSNVTATGGWV